MFGFRHAIGIDCQDDVWRVAVLREAGGSYEVIGVAAMPATGESPDRATALARLLAASGIARKRVAGALPASGCAFKTTSLPPGNPAELAEVVRFEAEHQLPLPLQELVWGYTLTPEPAQRRHAVIVGARRTLIDEQLAVLEHAGGTPVALQPAPLAAMQAIGQPGGIFVLVLAGSTWSDLCLYDGERLLACRSVLAGDPAGDGWAARIARELRSWMITQDDLRQVLLLGAVTEEIAHALAQAAALPVTIADPWHGVRDPRGLLPALAGPPAAYAVAVGLAHAALHHQPAPNLLPSSIRHAAEQQRSLAWVLAGLLCVLALLLPLALSGQRTLQARAAQLQQAERQARQARRTTIAAPSPAVAAAGQTVAALQGSASRPLEILRRLSAELPAGMLLTDFTYLRDKTVVLQGRADSHAVLASAMTAINRTAIFEQVMLNYANLVKENAGQGYDFQLTCTLPTGDDATLGTGKPSHAAPRRTGGAGR